MTLCFKKFVATGEYQIGNSKKLGLPFSQTFRRVLERGQLVHAIVDNRQWFQMFGERQCHRRVVPEHVLLNVMIQDQIIDNQALESYLDFQVTQVTRQLRSYDIYSGIPSAQFHSRLGCGEDRFLYEKNTPVFCATTEQVLRTLIDRIPAKVREANKIRCDRIQRCE